MRIPHDRTFSKVKLFFWVKFAFLFIFNWLFENESLTGRGDKLGHALEDRRSTFVIGLMKDLLTECEVRTETYLLEVFVQTEQRKSEVCAKIKKRTKKGAEVRVYTTSSLPRSVSYFFEFSINMLFLYTYGSDEVSTNVPVLFILRIFFSIDS